MVKKIRDFEFKDIAFEPKLDISGDIEAVTDFNAVRQSIISILTTKKGERVMRPTFGSNIWELLFEPIDEITEDKIIDETAGVIRTFEPRVNLQNVKVISDEDKNTINLLISYSIKGTIGTTQNLNIQLRR